MAHLVLPPTLNAYHWVPAQHPMCERCSNTDFSDTHAILSVLNRLHRPLIPDP